jgi:formylglycine-generating enzyme required for sulfatase activity
LQQHGWHVWIAPESIRPGEKWVEAINRGLEESGAFALVLTPAAIKSRWVKDETNVAIELEHEGRVRFVPLDVENCDVPPLWRAYQRVSFCGDYVSGLRSLVFALDPAQRDRQLREEAAQREAARQAKLAAEEAEAKRKVLEEAEQQEVEQQSKLAADKAEAERKAQAGAERLEQEQRESATRGQDAREEAERQGQIAQTRRHLSSSGLRRLWWIGASIAVVMLAIWAIGAIINGPGQAKPNPGATRIAEKDGMVMVYVPAGKFLMGSSDSDKQAYSDEKPQHEVYVDAFWIDQTEVTNAMFRRFVSTAGYKTEAEKVGSGWGWIGGEWKEIKGADWQHPHGPDTNIVGLDDHPVVQVIWNDAQAYCQWTGRRLPTEAEWEKAARGTDGRKYPWGNDPITGTLLNFCDKNCEYSHKDGTIDDGYAYTAPVNSYPAGASPYGALNMAGNVWEWVADWYDEKYYASSSVKSPNPQGPTTGQYHVLRGGAWNYVSQDVRAADRYWNPPDIRLNIVGFRCSR